jgi:hypothetical protein
LISQRFGCCRRRRIFYEEFDDEKEKDGMKNASDDPRYPVDIRYRRTDEVDLPVFPGE